MIFVKTDSVTELFREIMNIRLKKSSKNTGEDKNISR